MKKYHLRRAIRKHAAWQQEFPHPAKSWGSLINYAANDIIDKLPDDFTLENVILVEATFAHPDRPLRYLPALAFDPIRALVDVDSIPISTPEPMTIEPIPVAYAHGKYARLYLQIGIGMALRDDITERYLFIWPMASQ